MRVELWIANNGPWFALVSDGEGSTVSLKSFLVLCGDRQCDGDRLVDHTFVQKAVEVLALEEFSLPHEPGEWCCPAPPSTCSHCMSSLPTSTLGRLSASATASSSFSSGTVRSHTFSTALRGTIPSA